MAIPPKPPEGYKLLEPDDGLSGGDQFYCPINGQWLEAGPEITKLKFVKDYPGWWAGKVVEVQVKTPTETERLRTIIAELLYRGSYSYVIISTGYGTVFGCVFCREALSAASDSAHAADCWLDNLKKEFETEIKKVK